MKEWVEDKQLTVTHKTKQKKARKIIRERIANVNGDFHKASNVRRAVEHVMDITHTRVTQTRRKVTETQREVSRKVQSSLYLPSLRCLLDEWVRA